MNKDGITVTHSGTDRYTQMSATGFSSYHKDGYSTFNADGLFRYVENPSDMNSQRFRYLTVGTTGLLTFEEEYASQVSIELPGTFDHIPSSEIQVIFVFNCPFLRDGDRLIAYYDVPARAYSGGWYKNSDGHWQHDELYCTLMMYDMNNGTVDYEAGYVMYYAFA